MDVAAVACRNARRDESLIAMSLLRIWDKPLSRSVDPNEKAATDASESVEP
jgi:hypothetical protein